MVADAIETVTIAANEKDNEALAAQVRATLNQHNVFAMSIQGGAGCGKTALIEATLKMLGKDRKCAVIEGDAFTSLDGERIAALGVPVVQINTDGSCHLTANMVLETLPRLDLDATEILFIENLGDLNCAARFELGEHRRAACISACDGLQLLDKYPAIFAVSDVNLITKADLAEHVKFDVPRAVSRLHRINAKAKVLVTDAISSDGIDTFCRCIRREMEDQACLP